MSTAKFLLGFTSLYLLVCCSSPVSGVISECRIYLSSIELTHTCSGVTQGFTDCSKHGGLYGLAVQNLSVYSSSNSNCNTLFTTLPALDIMCLRNQTKWPEEYDNFIFDLLEAVSGKTKIQKDSIRLPVLRLSESENATITVYKNNTCRAVTDPESVLDICGNRTLEGNRVYLTWNPNQPPEVSSKCQCSIRTSSGLLSVYALDVRLQNISNRSCGPSTISISSGEDHKDFVCRGKMALFGSQLMFQSDKEILLALSSISVESSPTAIWIDVKAEELKSTATVVCYGPSVLQVPTTETNGPDDINKDNSGDPVDFLPIILGAVVGGVVLIVIIVIIWIICRNRNRRDFCFSFSKNRDGESGATTLSYNPVPQSDGQPIYAEPNNPDLCANGIPIQKYHILEGGESYTEPNVRNNFSSLDIAPPPVPASPPPRSPPPSSPPPKPKRSALSSSGSQENGNQEPEEYDHIESGTFKSNSFRQNNNVKKESVDLAENVYNHLEAKDNYSKIETLQNPRKIVVDNIYDKTFPINSQAPKV